jgi:hypothetical protein
VGGILSQNDTGLPTQHPHSAGDGCIVQVGVTAPRSDSQAVSEDRRGGVTFDLDTRDVLGHLMLPSGE